MSVAELSIVALVMLLVFGPEQLPVLARQAGRLVAKWRHFQYHIDSHINEHVLQLTLEANQQKAAKADMQNRPGESAHE